MTTRAQLRTMVRTRLEDTTATPLWSDAVLNELIRQAVYNYSTVVPLQAVMSVEMDTGAVEGSLGDDVAAFQVRHVWMEDRTEVQRIAVLDAAPDPDDLTLPLYWSGWGDTIRVSRAVQASEAGTWLIGYETARVVADDDVSQLEIEDGHETAVVAWTAGIALQRRYVEDIKRGAASVAGEAGAVMVAEAMALLRKRRVARGGALQLA